MTETTDLAALIRRHQDLTGDSYAEIARKTGLSKAKIGQIAVAGARYQVRPETMQKLAEGLKIPFEVVRSSALVTLGVAGEATARNTRIDLITSQLQKLDEETLAMVEAMVDAIVGVRTRG